MTEQTVEQKLATLREPFPPGSVGKLPRNLKKNDQDRGKCRVGFKNRGGYAISADGHFCGGYHARSIHLDYVGHANVTDRLLTVDPSWTWEFAMRDETGQPSVLASVDPDQNLWIRLTVCGVTRLGVGDGPSMKEKIGDAIRNAAMRFGVALDLWSKDELESGNAEVRPEDQPAGPSPEVKAARDELWAATQPHGDTPQERVRVMDAALAGLGTTRDDATAEQLRAAITHLDTIQPAL